MADLCRRAPALSSYTSSRKEGDLPSIRSGVFRGITTGAPISIIIPNRDVCSEPYEKMAQVLRPGHCQFSYLAKYGIVDSRGGGRASARETACRVAAGAVAKKILASQALFCHAYVKQIGSVIAVDLSDLGARERSPLYCPDLAASSAMEAELLSAQGAGDSLGGVVEFCVANIPAGWGDPLYEKLEANLAKAFFSIPAVKGFEVGSGFAAAAMRGSQHNDPFIWEGGGIRTRSNHAGGVLGGISTGMPLIGRIAFKPASSISIPQESITYEGAAAQFQLSTRYDICIAVRAVPVVEAMVALVLTDAFLFDRLARL